MKKSAKIKIDPKKLRLRIEQEGYTMSDASIKCGHGRSFINQCLARGTITNSCAKLIENELGIFLTEYMKREPEPEPEEAKQDEYGAVGAFSVADQILAELKDIKNLLKEMVELWH